MTREKSSVLYGFHSTIAIILTSVEAEALDSLHTIVIITPELKQQDPKEPVKEYTTGTKTPISSPQKGGGGSPMKIDTTPTKKVDIPNFVQDQLHISIGKNTGKNKVAP